MKKSYQLFGTLLLVLGLAAFAQATTIDFGPAFGAPAVGHVVLTNQLAAYGVVFSTTDPDGVCWWGGDFPYTPGQYSISAGQPQLLSIPTFIEPIRVDFSTPIAHASIRGFDGGNDIDTLILKAFNSSNVLIDSESITDIFTDPGLIAKVHGANIAYITFEVSVLGDHGLFFDDLTFNPAPIPGAVWLFASGLIAFWGLRKKV